MWPTKLVRMLIVNWFDDTSINDWLEIVETCTKGCSPSEKKQENVGILLNVLTRNKGGDALASKNSEKWCCSIITHKRQLIQHSNDRKNHQCPPHQWTVAPPAHTPPTDNMTQQNLPGSQNIRCGAGKHFDSSTSIWSAVPHSKFGLWTWPLLIGLC